MEVIPILFETIFTEELFHVPTPPVVIIDRPWEMITSSERNLLEKILTAIRLSLHSVTIDYQPTLNLAGLTIKPQRIIYFGQPVKGIPLYEVVEANGIALVASENLEALSQNDEARKKLWQALKKQFSV
jgi:DNA polymerase III psi subunit